MTLYENKKGRNLHYSVYARPPKVVSKLSRVGFHGPEITHMTHRTHGSVHLPSTSHLIQARSEFRKTNQDADHAENQSDFTTPHMVRDTYR